MYDISERIRRSTKSPVREGNDTTKRYKIHQIRFEQGDTERRTTGIRVSRHTRTRTGNMGGSDFAISGHITARCPNVCECSWRESDGRSSLMWALPLERPEGLLSPVSRLPIDRVADTSCQPCGDVPQRLLCLGLVEMLVFHLGQWANHLFGRRSEELAVDIVSEGCRV